MLWVPRAGKFVPRKRCVPGPGLFLAPSWCLAKAGSCFRPGCNFSKGCSRAAGLRSAQLPGESTGSAGGQRCTSAPPLPTACPGCLAKSAQNMAEMFKPDVLPPLWLQRKGKGLGLCCGWGWRHLLRVGRLPVRVALTGMQDRALGCTLHCPPMLTAKAVALALLTPAGRGGGEKQIWL